MALIASFELSRWCSHITRFTLEVSFILKAMDFLLKNDGF